MKANLVIDPQYGTQEIKVITPLFFVFRPLSLKASVVFYEFFQVMYPCILFDEIDLFLHGHSVNLQLPQILQQTR